MTILERIVSRKERCFSKRRSGLAEVIRQPGLSVIAEFKRRSPSQGLIGADVDPVRHALAYVQGGASSLSVLTDEEEFGGSLDDLAQISAALPETIALMRKDFIVHPQQIAEACVCGASAVLLIVAALSQRRLTQLLECAHALELDALVEVHDEQEVQAALDAGAQILGVNNRNLHTFEVDLSTAERLASAIPDELLRVAESGIESPEDARRMARAGFDAVLVGTALMRETDPKAFIAQCRTVRD